MVICVVCRLSAYRDICDSICDSWVSRKCALCANVSSAILKFKSKKFDILPQQVPNQTDPSLQETVEMDNTRSFKQER